MRGLFEAMAELCGWTFDGLTRSLRLWLNWLLGLGLAMTVLTISWAVIGSFVNSQLLNTIFAVLFVCVLALFLIVVFPIFLIGGWLNSRFPAARSAFRFSALIITQMCLFGIIVSGLPPTQFANRLLLVLLFTISLIVAAAAWLPLETHGWRLHLVRSALILLIMVARFAYPQRLTAWFENIQHQDVVTAENMRTSRSITPQEIMLASINCSGENAFAWYRTERAKNGQLIRTARYWYGRDVQDNIHVYTEPGFQPTTGQTLLLIDSSEEIAIICSLAKTQRESVSNVTPIKNTITPTNIKPEKRRQWQTLTILELQPDDQANWPSIDLNENGNYLMTTEGKICLLTAGRPCYGAGGDNWSPGNEQLQIAGAYPLPEANHLALIATINDRRIKINNGFKLKIDSPTVIRFGLNLPPDSAIDFNPSYNLRILVKKEEWVQ